VKENGVKTKLENEILLLQKENVCMLVLIFEEAF